ncbi:MAG: hypothetical protein ACSHWZ_08960 [Sulfitobacter sp.]
MARIFVDQFKARHGRMFEFLRQQTQSTQSCARIKNIQASEEAPEVIETFKRRALQSFAAQADAQVHAGH